MDKAAVQQHARRLLQLLRVHGCNRRQLAAAAIKALQLYFRLQTTVTLSLMVGTRRGRRWARANAFGLRQWLRFKVGKRRLQRRLSGDELEAAMSQLHAKLARKTLAFIRRQQGMYVKFGQMMAAAEDDVRIEWRQALQQLQADAQPAAFADMAAYLDRQLGRPSSEVFASIDRTPLGSGSIGQVFAARTHDGRDVVIKLQYPQVAECFRDDLRTFELLVRVGVPSLRNYMKGIRKQFLTELDFAHEAALQQQLADRIAASDCTALSDVHVPSLLPQLCTERMIVMERVVGQHLAAAAGGLCLAERQRIFTAIATLSGEGMFVHGSFIADPHQGNHVLTAAMALYVIDFGQVATLSTAQRRTVARLVVATASGDYEGGAELLLADGWRQQKSKQSKKTLALLLKLSSGATYSQQESDWFSRQMEKNPIIELPAFYAFFLRTLHVLNGVCMQLKLAREEPSVLMRVWAPLAQRALE
eukprot:PLAT1451.1.p1 GENE.PLAT1451.1~~PLAT1451.1.p1  ORF type:complete len:475 (-),score=206.07 PLAT1451.1:187-1611(-)